MATVTFSSVGKVYPDGTRAVRDLELEISDGEFIVFVGPSGCGKTTALRMVAGLEEISEGEIWIGDRVVNDLEPRERDVAMVFQSYALYPHMSVYDNIAFGLRMQKVPRGEMDRRVREIGRILGLEGLFRRKPRQLSGGQRQRVAMGRAIVRRPSVFLMDEPLSNLDARLRVQMRGEIARIQHELEATTIYVTHDQVEAMTMGDRVAVLRKGELQQTADPETLYEEPVNLFVASFIGNPAMNLAEARLARSDGRLVVSVGDHKLELSPEHAACRPALARYDGQTVAVGIRPEHLRSATAGDAPSVRLAGTALFTESLGSERLVHVAVAAPPVVTEEVLEVARDVDAAIAEELSGEAEKARTVFVARVDASVRPRPNDRVELAFDPAKLHFFDPETGAGIYG